MLLLQGADARGRREHGDAGDLLHRSQDRRRRGHQEHFRDPKMELKKWSYKSGKKKVLIKYKMAKQRAVIEKIKKLLALSDLAKNNNVNEAIVAAAAAQSLMDKHRLTYEKISFEAEGLKTNKDEVVDYIKHFGTFFGIKNPNNWQRLLAKTIAEHNHCRCYGAKINSGAEPEFSAMSIVGREDDILITEELYFYLEVEISKICLSEWSKKEFIQADEETKQWRSDFCLGAVAQLKSKLDEVSKTEHGVEYKFALLRLEKKKEELEDFFLKLKLSKMESTKPVNYNSFSKGYKAAEKISITMDKQLEVL